MGLWKSEVAGFFILGVRRQGFLAQWEASGEGQRTGTIEGRGGNRETSEKRLQESRQEDRGGAGAEGVKGKAEGLRDVLGGAQVQPTDGLDTQGERKKNPGKLDLRQKPLGGWNRYFL